MKTNKYLPFAAILLLLSSCLSPAGEKNESTQKLEVIDSLRPTFILLPDSFNFGTIREGSIIKDSFQIKNISEHALVIYDIRTGCGCTVVKWSKKPISKNESSVVEFAFNSRNRIGRQEKMISIYTNARKGIRHFSLVGEVVVSK